MWGRGGGGVVVVVLFNQADITHSAIAQHKHTTKLHIVIRVHTH